jgi:hypothetical protein
MTVFRGLALAAAVLAVQFSLPGIAQASALQVAEVSKPFAALHVGFFPVEPHRLAPAAPLMVSAESSMSYGRMTSSSSIERPNAAGALAAYYASGSRLTERERSQAIVPPGATTGTWAQGANRWQFDETSRDWAFHSGHWRDFEDGHHGRDDDGYEHPPAVPIPAGLWLLGSGFALLAFLIGAQRGRGMAAAR